MKSPAITVFRVLRTTSGMLALVCIGMAAKRLDLQLNYVAVPGFSVSAPGALPGHVKLNAAAPARITISLQSNNPSVALVPPAVSIPAGSDNGAFNVTAMSGGCATITASYGGKKESTYIVVHPASSAAGVSLSVPNENLHQVWVPYYTGTITTNGTFSGTLYLSSSNPQVAGVPASVAVKTGATRTQFPITTTGLGCAIITATVKGARGEVTTTSRTVNVVPLPG